MKKLITTLAIASLVASISGCVSVPDFPPTPIPTTTPTAPTAPPVKEADIDYGTYPENYKEIISDYMQSKLKDPESARYHYFDGPEKNPITPEEPGNTGVFGYSMLVLINAKNSFGGYTGGQCYIVRMRNGVVHNVENQTQKLAALYRKVGMAPGPTTCDDILESQGKQK